MWYMSFFKKIFKGPKKQKPTENNSEHENLPLDEIFVKNFIKNKGKFLYSSTLEEVTENLSLILSENDWSQIICNDNDLTKLIATIPVSISQKFSNEAPIFLSCEHLIAKDGSILLSSNQLKDTKISKLSDHFIVYATTSQIVKNKGEALTGINSRYKGNIPSNISAISKFSVQVDEHEENDFMNYGNTNSKNLYLLLFEDL